MNLVETGRLLAKVSGSDGREVGEVTILAWQEVLADVAYPDAMAAVTMHYRESTDFLMPAHLVRLAGTVRAQQRRAHLDALADQRMRALDDVPVKDRTADVAALIQPKVHNLTLRRRDQVGARWAFSCSCGINPIDQAWPSKAVARQRGREHMPAASNVGAS